MKHETSIPSVASIQDSCHEDEIVLANYTGTVFFPSGIRLSVDQQCRLDSLFDTDICKGHYRRILHVALSSEDAVMFAHPGFGDSDTYGEIRPESFLEVLWKLGARPGERFYDLGSGTGKLAAIAWLTGLTATGIELSCARSEIAWQLLSQLENHFAEGTKFSGKSSFPKAKPGGLNYICGSMYDVDFTDADVVFFSSVMFTKGLVARMVTIARWMKPGSRIISYHDLANLGAAGSFPELKLLGEINVSTSWNAASCWLVHEVVANPPQAERSQSDLITPNQGNTKELEPLLL